MQLVSKKNINLVFGILSSSAVFSLGSRLADIYFVANVDAEYYGAFIFLAGLIAVCFSVCYVIDDIFKRFFASEPEPEKRSAILVSLVAKSLILTILFVAFALIQLPNVERMDQICLLLKQYPLAGYCTLILVANYYQLFPQLLKINILASVFKISATVIIVRHFDSDLTLYILTDLFFYLFLSLTVGYLVLKSVPEGAWKTSFVRIKYFTNLVKSYGSYQFITRGLAALRQHAIGIFIAPLLGANLAVDLLKLKMVFDTLHNSLQSFFDKIASRTFKLVDSSVISQNQFQHQSYFISLAIRAGLLLVGSFVYSDLLLFLKISFNIENLVIFFALNFLLGQQLQFWTNVNLQLIKRKTNWHLLYPISKNALMIVFLLMLIPTQGPAAFLLSIIFADMIALLYLMAIESSLKRLFIFLNLFAISVYGFWLWQI